MSSGDLLNIHPTELKFSFELRKKSSCSIQLANKTDQHIAFKVKTTTPKKYCVRPNAGIVLPGSTCNVTVIMQAQKEAPLYMQCKDKFLIQSAVSPDDVTSKDITQAMFNNEDGKIVQEFKLRVIYVPANPPSPVPEGSEEGSPVRIYQDEFRKSTSSAVGAKSLEQPNVKSSSSEAWSVLSKLTEEKASAIQQNQNLHLELEVTRRAIDKRQGGAVSMLFVLMIGFIGVLVGYLIKA